MHSLFSLAQKNLHENIYKKLENKKESFWKMSIQFLKLSHDSNKQTSFYSISEGVHDPRHSKNESWTVDTQSIFAALILYSL